MFDLKGRRIWVAGHNGMVGSAIVRRLADEQCTILAVPRSALDLIRQSEVETFLAHERPDAIVIAAARVGGIVANDSYAADFLHDNLMIETNIIAAAHQAGVDRLLFLGSSCIYPWGAPQPIDESSLLTGPLEPTNQWYAVAKIAGIKLTQAYRKQHGRDYIAAMPANLYGPADNFDLQTSHVLPALIRKAHDAKLSGAKSMLVWGSGSPLREFLHVDDCADALVLLLKTYSDGQHINVGSGYELSILDLARLVCRVVGYGGDLIHDRTKPDGAPRKLLSSARLNAMNWRPRVQLEQGISETYQWFLANANDEKTSFDGQAKQSTVDRPRT
ncbi:MAG: GDP-L-fucose synthase [Devosia sp.]